MMTHLKLLWNEGSVKFVLRHHRAGAEVIVDDVFCYSDTIETLFQYFIQVLKVLIFHCFTIKLKKSHFLEPELQFVGRDISAAGNSPAVSKFAAFRELPPPSGWTELRMIVGMFGFYAAWLERYEFRIRLYRRLQSLQPAPGQLTRVQETELMKTLWLPEHQALFEQLKSEILAKPVLARPDSNRRFYIKTDWCSNGMAAALLQADPDDLDALDAEAVESIGGPCFFDLQKKGIRLRPIEFISRATSMAEKSFHSYVGEASVARWAFPRWKRYLLGRVFTWLSDCSGLKRFFDGDDHPTHTIQRWRAELLQYVFTLEHRPAEMLTECDVLSRYNMATSEWYDTTTANDTDVIEPTVPAAVSAARVLPTIASIFDPIELEDNRKPTSWYSLPSIMRIGHPTWPSSNIATMATSQERVILVTGAATVPIDHALDLLGVDGTILRFDTGIPNEYANRLRLARQNHFFANLHTLEHSRIDWFLAVYTDQPSDDGKPDQRLNNWFETSLNQALALIQAVNLKAAMIMCPIVFPSAARIANSRFTAPSGWQFRIITLRNTYHGGSIETDHEVFLLLRDDAANAFSLPIITSTPGAMNEIIDIDPNPQTFLWLNDLSVKPAPEIIERRDEHDQSAHTVKLVKLRSDAKPFDGWNTFCPSRPGPSIARPRP